MLKFIGSIISSSLINTIIILATVGLIGCGAVFYFIFCYNYRKPEHFTGIIKDKDGDFKNSIHYLALGDTDIYNLHAFYIGDTYTLDSLNIGDTIIKIKGADTAIVKCTNGKRVTLHYQARR